MYFAASDNEEASSKQKQYTHLHMHPKDILCFKELLSKVYMCVCVTKGVPNLQADSSFKSKLNNGYTLSSVLSNEQQIRFINNNYAIWVCTTLK